MVLHPKQKEVINSNKRYKLLNWGRRSGKTTVVGYEIFTTLWNEEGLVSYYAPTHSDARDIAWEIYKEILEPITIKTNETLLEIEVKNSRGTTSLLRMTGWEAVKNRDKGRGVENNLVVLDECAFFPSFKDKFEKVIEPTLLTTKGRLIICSTPNGFNHFYDYANIAMQDESWFYSHATSYDNPFNDQEELERLKRTKSDDAFSQEYLADFRKKEGLVFKDFSRQKHVYNDATIIEVDRMAGIDWGWTNPASSHLFQKDKDRHYWISNEFYKSEQTTDQIIEHVKSLRPTKVYPDPAEPDRNDQARRAGLNVREVSKDIEAGISCVQELLKQGRIHIHSSCVNLIYEFETYAYPEKKPDHNENELPIKENDHALDESRYVLYMQEGKTNSSVAQIHYPSSNTPRNNLTPFQKQQGLPRELRSSTINSKPNTAHTFVPHG